MKKFLSKIMVFLILLTIIYIITAQTFRYLDLQVKGESGRMRYIHNELIADSIIMGSSRALHHYDPDILGNLMLALNLRWLISFLISLE